MIQYYVRRHLRTVINSRLNKLRDGVVLLQRRWLDRQRKRLSTLRKLARDAAAAGRWRTQRLIAMKKARVCGVEAAAMGVVWAERKADELWQERYRSLQQLTFDEARRRGAEMQHKWALGVVRNSVRRRSKTTLPEHWTAAAEEMDTMSGLLLQSIADVLVRDSSSASSSDMPGGVVLPKSNSILRNHCSSPSLPSDNRCVKPTKTT